MSVSLPLSRHTFGLTFLVALALLGLGALLQVGVVGWAFYQRARSGATGPALATAPGTTAGREFADPFDEDGDGNRNAVATPPPKPTPISMEALRPYSAPTTVPEPTEADRFQELIEHAQLLRQRGDTYTAITKLREAQAMKSESPVPLAEMAMTYEKMGNAEKAAEAWRQVYDMGDAAGVYFAAAEAKMKASQEQALRRANTPATASTATPAPGAAPGTEAASPLANVPVASSGGPQVGLTPNAKLGLLSITKTEQPEALMARRFVLNVPVKVKPRSRVDGREVVVQVLFYDMVNGRLDRTSAEISNQWTMPPADWLEEEVETLQVTYSQPASRVSDEERKYFGYIVALYYKNALQDYRAEPASLAEQAPPAKSLSTDPTP